MEQLYLGLDPGGVTSFAWALLCGSALPLTVVATGLVEHAKAAIDAVDSMLDGLDDDFVLTAVGIDAPLFWQSAGDRVVDQIVRSSIKKCGASPSTVNNVNSMPGACVIQGMMAAILLRGTRSDLPLTEAHPKALLWLLGQSPETTSLADLHAYMTLAAPQDANEHERDAALGALSAFAMTGHLYGWQDLYPHELDPITPLCPRPGYWMPMSIQGSV